MSAVGKFLRGLKKAELQTIHQFWLPGESANSKVEELRYRVEKVFVSGEGVPEKVARLSQTQKRLIQDVLSRPEPKAQINEIQEGLAQSGASRIEVESTVRQLTERGFVTRQRKDRSRGSEFLEIPDELADHLARALNVGGQSASAADSVSFRMLEASPSKLEAGVDERVESIEDPLLAELCRRALGQRGVLNLDSDEIVDYLETEGGEEIDEEGWRQILEEKGIGTIGDGRLQDYGITLPDTSLVIFQELSLIHI